MGKQGKRKAGHIGFQASEIAFIEDEMAAYAAEYGLEVEEDVASSVSKRKTNKKARHNKHKGATSATTAIKVAVKKNTRAKDAAEDDNEKKLRHLLSDVLPDGCSLSKCAVPGCACANGSREIDVDDAKAQASDLMRASRCKRCQHGVLQHVIVMRDGDEQNVPLTKATGGQRLFGAFYQLVRFARLAATVYESRIWAQAAMDLLRELLNNLRKQFAAGGSANGQRTTTELLHEQQLMTEVLALVQRTEKLMGKTARDEMPIVLACTLDQMFFQTYYACIVLYGRGCGAVPAPEAYFADVERLVPTAHEQLEQFLNSELNDQTVPREVLDSLALPLADASGRTKASDSNPLLELFHARLREGIRLFYGQGIGLHGEMDAVLADPQAAAQTAPKSNKKKPQKKHYRREKANQGSSGADSSGASAGTPGQRSGDFDEVPCYPLLAQWRDNCRDWGCHLYAYATPTEEALATIAKYAPLVEMGAGTGYWSSLLQAKDVDILAYDKCPPAVSVTASNGGNDALDKKKANRKKADEKNAYHGQVPPFCPMAKGGPETLSSVRELHGRSLLLCYPPPKDPMALDCLRNFTGKYVLHVGEWQGDTGERKFEKRLARDYTLVKEVALPNWGNTAYSLTVWQRRQPKKGKHNDNSVDDRPLRALSCFRCHKTADEAEEEGEELRRCVLCKTNAYCSSECAESDHVGNEQRVQLRRKVRNADTELLEWVRCTCVLAATGELLVYGSTADGEDEGDAAMNEQLRRIDVVREMLSIEQKKKNKTRCVLVLADPANGHACVEEELMAPSARLCHEFVLAVLAAQQSARRKHSMLAGAVRAVETTNTVTSRRILDEARKTMANAVHTNNTAMQRSQIKRAAASSTAAAARATAAINRLRARENEDSLDVDLPGRRAGERWRPSAYSATGAGGGSQTPQQELHILMRVESALRQLEREKAQARERELQLTHEVQALQDALRVKDAERKFMEEQFAQLAMEKEEWKQAADRAQQALGQMEDELLIAREESQLLSSEQSRLKHQNKELLTHVHRLDSLTQRVEGEERSTTNMAAEAIDNGVGADAERGGEDAAVPKPTETKTLADLAKDVKKWTLHSDYELHVFLKNYSANLFMRTKQVEDSVRDIAMAADTAHVRLKNTFNEFLMLSNNQFIENRVYDEEQEDFGLGDTASTSQATPAGTAEGDSSNTSNTVATAEAEGAAAATASTDGAAKTSGGDSVVNKYRSALDMGMEAMKLFALLDDEDDRSDTSSQFDTVLDIYNERPLPFIIGTREFLEDETLGLGAAPDELDSESSIDSESDYGSSYSSSDESESEEEVAPRRKPKKPADGAIVAVPPTKPRSDSIESDMSGLFGSAPAPKDSSERSAVAPPQRPLLPQGQSSRRSRFEESDSEDSDWTSDDESEDDKKPLPKRVRPGEEEQSAPFTAAPKTPTAAPKTPTAAQPAQQTPAQQAQAQRRAQFFDSSDDDSDGGLFSSKPKPADKNKEKSNPSLFGEEKSSSDLFGAPPAARPQAKPRAESFDSSSSETSALFGESKPKPQPQGFRLPSIEPKSGADLK
ncbi:TPA: hypothetical protein N0F65_000580, partial [Lagenidium giganteum]